MKFEVVGKKLSPADKEKALEFIRRERREKVKFQPGEIQKTPDEIRLIGKLNDYLVDEQRELGIENPGSIAPEQVHYFKMTPMDEAFYGYRYRGSVSPSTGFAEVHKASTITLPELGEETLHEMAHMASHTKLRLENLQVPDWFKPDRIEYSAYRTGHVVNNPESEKRRDPHHHFIGLNEAIIQKMIAEILEKRWEELKSEFGFKDADKEKLFKSYRKLIGVLEMVIRGVAQKEGKSGDAVWKNFKKEEFSGGLQHLRSVERAFGNGAMRILAALPNPHIGKLNKVKGGVNPDISMKLARELIEQFFQESNPVARDAIAERLLVKRELGEYRKRRNMRETPRVDNK